MQRAWLSFRDAQIDLLYPHRQEANYYGTVLPMCINIELTRITLVQIKNLNRWLHPSEEGDACAGSIL